MPGPTPPHEGPPWGAGSWGHVDPDAPSRGPSRALRLWIPVVLSAFVQLGAAGWILRVEHPAPPTAALTVGLAALGPLALIAARRFPGPVVAVVAAAAVAELLFGAVGGPPPLAFAFALAGAVARGARVWAWTSFAAGWAIAFGVSLLDPPGGWTSPRIVGTTLGLLLAIGLGELIRSRRERMRAFRAAAARRRRTAAEEERLRIARELHDVLAHSLSQINVQAGVGLHLAEAQPEKAVEALAAIKQASRTALDDVRAVLGVLRAEGEDAPRAPQPGVAGIAALVAATGIPGVQVVLDDDLGEREVPAPVGAAAYRIVQEALTNVARHGDGVTRVDVRLARDAHGIRIEVRDDGHVAPFEPGRGLLGMRERVEQLGGDFEIVRDGGFVIRARLPIGGEGA